MHAAQTSATSTLFSSLQLLEHSPRQGVLSSGMNHPLGLETLLSQCQADNTNPESYLAVIITKPPETVTVLLPPSPSLHYILLDFHPRPNQLSPHFPAGSYALFHPNLNSLVTSLKHFFPVTELGNDIPEMMAMMYNSFDAYPFR